MALRDTVKSSRSGGSKTRAATKSRPAAAKTPSVAAQPLPVISQPVPPIPEVYDYIRALARIPGLRKTPQQ